MPTTWSPTSDWAAGAGRRACRRPRSREELAYQRMFAERLQGMPADVLGRFATA